MAHALCRANLALVALAVCACKNAAAKTREAELTCRVTAAVRVDAQTLRSMPSSDNTVYRFSGKRLILHPTDRAAYEYGTLTQDGPDRFRVGNKLILFNDATGAKALLTHVDVQEVRVLRLFCN